MEVCVMIDHEPELWAVYGRTVQPAGKCRWNCNQRTGCCEVSSTGISTGPRPSSLWESQCWQGNMSAVKLSLEELHWAQIIRKLWWTYHKQLFEIPLHNRGIEGEEAEFRSSFPPAETLHAMSAAVDDLGRRGWFPVKRKDKNGRRSLHFAGLMPDGAGITSTALMLKYIGTSMPEAAQFTCSMSFPDLKKRMRVNKVPSWYF